MAGTIKELRQQNKAKRQLRRQNRKGYTSGLDLSGAPTFTPTLEAIDFTPVGNLNLPQIDNFQMLDIAPAYRNRGEAFNAARKRGDDTFWYGGKEYTTETKEEQDARLGTAAKNQNKPISNSNLPQQKSSTSRGVEGTRENTLGVIALEPETKETKFQFNYDRDDVGSSNPDIKVWLNKEDNNTRKGVVIPQWRVTDRNTFFWNDPAIIKFAEESTLGPYEPDYALDEYKAYLQAQDTEAARRRLAQQKVKQEAKHIYSTVPFKRQGGKFPIFRNGGKIN